MAGQSLQYLDRLSTAKSNDRALRLELAEGYLRLGTILVAPSGCGDSLVWAAPARRSRATARLWPFLNPWTRRATGVSRSGGIWPAATFCWARR
jgi:hypothetical protein